MKKRIMKRMLGAVLVAVLIVSSMEVPVYADLIQPDMDVADNLLSANDATEKYSVSENDVREIEVEGTTDINGYLTIEDKNNVLEADVRENLKMVFSRTWKQICDFFNNGNILQVKLIVDKTYTGEGDVAYTQGQTITINPNYFNTQKADYDAFTHELIHVAQNYKGYVDGWLIEGIADYGRNKYGINNVTAGWKLEPVDSTSANYTDGYRTTADFLCFIEKNYKSDFVYTLNQKIKTGEYSSELFRIYTGLDIDDLWEVYLKNCGIQLEEIDCNLKTFQRLDESMDVSSYLELTDVHNLVDNKTKANIRNLFNARYAAICNAFGMGKLNKVKIEITSYDGVAYTDVSQNLIVVGGAYLKANPEDYDCITHELVHVAQGYTKNIPGWLVEGIADYGRDQFGVNNRRAGWDLPIVASVGGTYANGYTTAAGFLKWAEEKYNHNLVQILNQLCKEYDYRGDFFKKTTGYGVNQLWLQYKKDVPKHLNKLGQTCSDLNFKDENGEIVKLSDFGSKPVLIYYGLWDADMIEEELKDAEKYQEVLGNKITILVVYMAQSYEDVKKIMKETSIKKSFTMVFDASNSMMFNVVGKQTDDGYELDMRGKLLLDQNRKLRYASVDYMNVSVTLEDSLRKLFPKVDFNCRYKSSTKAVITNDATRVRKNQFKGQKKLKQITIGKNVSSIGANAFKNCSNLTKLTLPGKCNKIGTSAFSGCKKLKVLTIKSKKLTNKSVAKGAFKGMSKKTVIKVPKSKLKEYTKLFRKKGLSKKIKIRAI